jgi:hypothetical protein
MIQKYFISTFMLYTKLSCRWLLLHGQQSFNLVLRVTGLKTGSCETLTPFTTCGVERPVSVK